MRFSGLTFEQTERVRWSDVDSSSALRFGAFVRYVESAETEFYRAVGFSFRRFDELGVSLARVHMEYDFFKPAWLDDELILTTAVREVGAHSVHLTIEVSRVGSDVVLGKAMIVAACIDENRKSVALPEELANALRPHVRADHPPKR